jgi:hypothetical protein
MNYFQFWLKACIILFGNDLPIRYVAEINVMDYLTVNDYERIEYESQTNF